MEHRVVSAPGRWDGASRKRATDPAVIRSRRRVTRLVRELIDTPL